MFIVWAIVVPIQCLLVDRIVELFYRFVLKMNDDSNSKILSIIILSVPGYFGFGGEMGYIMFPLSNLFYLPALFLFGTDHGLNCFKALTFIFKSQDERLFALIHFSTWAISLWVIFLVFHNRIINLIFSKALRRRQAD